MAGRKSAGMAPLGHPALSKVHLEGPKVHHDFHGSKDSVPGKGYGSAIPGEHWEKKYNATDASVNMKLVEGADFNPKCPDERKTTYIKVNKQDH